METTTESMSLLTKYCNLNITVSYHYEKSDAFKSSMLYQSLFLSFMGLDQYKDKIVTSKLNNIYTILKSNTFVMNCVKTLKSHSNYASICIDDTYVFLLLFSYDYFEYFYKYLQNLYNSNDTSKDEEYIIKIISNY